MQAVGQGFDPPQLHPPNRNASSANTPSAPLQLLATNLPTPRAGVWLFENLSCSEYCKVDHESSAQLATAVQSVSTATSRGDLANTQESGIARQLGEPT